MTEQKKDPVVQYSPEEEAALARHEKQANFDVSCNVIGCPLCNYSGPPASSAQLRHEAQDVYEAPCGFEGCAVCAKLAAEKTAAAEKTGDAE